MIIAVVALAGTVVVLLALASFVVFKAQRVTIEQNNRLADTNQQLIAALLVTKNTPYATSSAVYASTTPDESGDGIGVVPMDASPVIPEGTKLLGT